MTEIQYCKNCKHLSTDGMFGLICDVCGDNKNYDCPKYEKKVIPLTEKYELRLCSNGTYYLYENRLLNQDISFDKFNKESAKELVSILNKQNIEIEDLKCRINSIYVILREEKCRDNDD